MGGGRAFMRGRGGRGGLHDAGMRRGRGFSREPPERFKGGWVAGPPGRGGPVARGRNIFPKEQHRGRGGRVNNLFKRFQAQHSTNWASLKVICSMTDLTRSNLEEKGYRGQGQGHEAG